MVTTILLTLGVVAFFLAALKCHERARAYDDHEPFDLLFRWGSRLLFLISAGLLLGLIYHVGTTDAASSSPASAKGAEDASAGTPNYDRQDQTTP